MLETAENQVPEATEHLDQAHIRRVGVYPMSRARPGFYDGHLMTRNKAPNAKKQKPFAATLDATAPLDDNATPFSPTADEVAYRAYLNFQNHGAADGHDVEDWLRAESELIAEHRHAGVC